MFQSLPTCVLQQLGSQQSNIVPQVHPTPRNRTQATNLMNVSVELPDEVLNLPCEFEQPESPMVFLHLMSKVALLLRIALVSSQELAGQVCISTFVTGASRVSARHVAPALWSTHRFDSSECAPQHDLRATLPPPAQGHGDSGRSSSSVQLLLPRCASYSIQADVTQRALVDTCKTKAQIWAKRTTQRAIHRTKKNVSSSRSIALDKTFRLAALLDRDAPCSSAVLFWPLACCPLLPKSVEKLQFRVRWLFCCSHDPSASVSLAERCQGSHLPTCEAICCCIGAQESGNPDTSHSSPRNLL